MKWMALVCIVLVLMAGIGERTTHFSVKYDESTEYSPGCGRTLEECYKVINGYFGNLPKSISVTVIDGAKMDSIGQHVEAFSAWNSKSSRIVLRDKTLKDPKSLGVVAKHEICHLALNDILEKKGGHDYAWMEEGTCMVLSREPLDEVKVAKYIVANGFMDLPEIAKAIDNDQYAITKNGYLQSYSLCKYVADHFGVQALVNLIKYPSSSFKTAFLKTTGKNFAGVYEDWKDSVEVKSHGKTTPNIVAIRGYLCLDEGA
jgi:hypothetical protein